MEKRYDGGAENCPGWARHCHIFLRCTCRDAVLASKSRFAGKLLVPFRSQRKVLSSSQSKVVLSSSQKKDCESNTLQLD